MGYNFILSGGKLVPLGLAACDKVHCATQRALPGRTCWPAVRTQAPAVPFRVSLSSSLRAQSGAFPGAACIWQLCKVGVQRPPFQLDGGQLWQATLTQSPLPGWLRYYWSASEFNSFIPPRHVLSTFLLQMPISNKHLTPQVLCFQRIVSTTQ